MLVRLSIESANRALIIKKLVDMLGDKGSSAQEQAAAALANLASDSAGSHACGSMCMWVHIHACGWSVGTCTWLVVGR